MRGRVGLVLALTVGLTLTEGAGLFLLVPLLELVGLDTHGGAVGQLAERVSALFVLVGVRPTLLVVLGVWVLVLSTRALLARWQLVATMSLQVQFAAYLRRRLYRAIANADWLFFSRSRASDFTHALTVEVDRVAMATQALLSLISSAVVTSVYLLVALQLSAIATGVVCVCGAGLWLVLKRRAAIARASGEALSLATNGLYAAAIEHLAGMKTVKSYDAQDRNVEDFSRLTERVAQVDIATTRNYAEVKSLFDVGSLLILGLIVLVLVELLAIPPAGIVLLLFVYARMMPRFSGMQQNYQTFMNTFPGFVTVVEMHARCQEAAEARPTHVERIELHDCIQLEQVTFSYERDGSAPVLRDVPLVVRAGDTTAVVGPSGAGKSTIADLVIGLILPNQGRVLVDRVPLCAERMHSWREQIGYVGQDTFLFHDTVRANLRWSRPEASDEEIRRALRLAAAEEFVSALPEGLDTIVGDRGVRLSGGERQRLALARALLRRPALLILDEATSNLDSEHEVRIQSAIEALHGSTTILVITHRLPTVRGADVIYVLEDGRVIERGDWNSLMAADDGRFRALCRAQGIERGADHELDHRWTVPTRA